MFILAFAGSVSAGDCANGVCNRDFRPVQKALSVTKRVLSAPVNVTRKVLVNKPVRSRLFNRYSCRRCN